MKNITKLFVLGLCVAALPTLKENQEVKADEDIAIEAFAHYEFNDETNIGKDSSVHHFDLKKQVTSASETAFQVLKDGDDNYISIRRDEYTTGVSKNSGAYLYAPQQGTTSYDYTDMIPGSYTVQTTFKSDNTKGLGDVYAISFGRYNSCFTIVPWKNVIQIQIENFDYAQGDTDEAKQSYIEKAVKCYSYSTLDWTTVTVSADAETNITKIFINGNLVDTVTLAGTKLTSKHDDYTLAIGAQCNIHGVSATQYGNVDVKDLQIYDCALSDENVAHIVNGETPTMKDQGDVAYVTDILDFDSSTIDLEITDANPINELTKTLPEKLKIKTSKGIERSYPAYWYSTNDGKIRGYVQSGLVNPSLKEIVLDYNYVCKFDYDSSAVTLKDVQLDGKDYVPGTPISSSKQTLSFKLDLVDGATLNEVDYFEMAWDPEDDGTYYIDIADGALIVIDAEAPEVSEYTITYKDGAETLGTSTYTVTGEETLKTFTKDGYTFEGWYTDEALENKYTSINRENPQDVTLYAKWTAASKGEEKEEPTTSKKGCKGAVTTSLISFISLAGVLLTLKKRK